MMVHVAHCCIVCDVGLKRVLGYSDSGRCQTSTRYCWATLVLGIYIDKFKNI